MSNFFHMFASCLIILSFSCYERPEDANRYHCEQFWAVLCANIAPREDFVVSLLSQCYICVVLENRLKKVQMRQKACEEAIDDIKDFVSEAIDIFTNDPAVNEEEDDE